MSLRRLALLALLVLSTSAVAPMSGRAAAAGPDPDHPYGEPIWYPLRESVRVSCVVTNCDGPYHGYQAMDLAGTRGDPIYAAGAGVFHIGDVAPGCVSGKPTRGTWVWIDHGPAGSTRYSHLETITASEGQLVTPETQIATMGNSGDAFPCETDYLHLEYRSSADDSVRLDLPDQLRACIGGTTVDLPQEFGFDTWDDVTPHVTHTPATDDSCMPDSWSDTPTRPGRPGVARGVGSLTVTPAARPAGVDAVRVRLELFHPSLNRFGRAVEQTISPTTSAALFDDLIDNRLYRALVSHHSDAGWSAWSSPVEATTGVMPSPPQFRDSDSSATTIGYKWHRGPNADADFEVAIRRAQGSLWGSWTYHDVPTTDLHIRIRDLDPGTKYQLTVRARNQFGVSGWAQRSVISTLCPDVCTSTPNVFTSMTPARIADSRAQRTVDGLFRNTGRRPGGSSWEIQVAGRAGVPPNSSAAIVNVTLLNSDFDGFATVYPCGERPTASSVNYRPGSVEPNEIIAKLSPSGRICVFTLSPADVIVDVVGHVTDSPYRALTPTRYADSRKEVTFDGAFRATGPRQAGTTWEIPIAGRGAVPALAEAVVVNLTATGSSGPGYATVFPCDSRPVASSLNFDTGITRANEIVARLSDDGAVCIFTLTDVEIVLDVVGYVGDVVGYSPISPIRLADSRDESTADGTHRDTGRRSAGTTWRIQVDGRLGVNAPDAVVANITVTDAVAPGFLTVFDCGTRPLASSLNYRVGTTRPNETIAKLSPDGALCIFTLSSAHVIVDLAGYTLD